MWQLKLAPYFIIYENIVQYLFKFVTTPYQFKGATKSWRKIIFVSTSKIDENTTSILNYYLSD